MAELLDPTEIFYTAYEPKMANRFIMYIDGIPSFMVKGVGAVSLTQGSVKLNHINVSRYVKGKTIWNPITFTMYESITPSGAQAVMEWVRLGHESVTGRDGYADFYKKDVTFNMLGPVGDIVEEWTLKGAYIATANFGEMAFESNEPADITLTLQYDYAILQF